MGASISVSFDFKGLSPNAPASFFWHGKAAAGAGKRKIGSP
jgi:hypothetical protein